MKCNFCNEKLRKINSEHKYCNNCACDYIKGFDEVNLKKWFAVPSRPIG